MSDLTGQDTNEEPTLAEVLEEITALKKANATLSQQVAASQKSTSDSSNLQDATLRRLQAQAREFRAETAEKAKKEAEENELKNRKDWLELLGDDPDLEQIAAMREMEKQIRQDHERTASAQSEELKALKEHASNVEKALKEQREGFAAEQEQRFRAELEELAPEVLVQGEDALNQNPDFMALMGEFDPVAGATYGEIMDSAMQNGNARQAGAIVEMYRQRQEEAEAEQDPFRTAVPSQTFSTRTPPPADPRDTRAPAMRRPDVTPFRGRQAHVEGPPRGASRHPADPRSGASGHGSRGRTYTTQDLEDFDKRIRSGELDNPAGDKTVKDFYKAVDEAVRDGRFAG